MAFILDSQILITGKGALQDKFGPYASVSAAIDAMKNDAIFEGFTFGVYRDSSKSVIDEYWFPKSLATLDEEGNIDELLVPTVADVELKTPVKLIENGFKVGDYTFIVE